MSDTTALPKQPKDGGQTGDGSGLCSTEDKAPEPAKPSTPSGTDKAN